MPRFEATRCLISNRSGNFEQGSEDESETPKPAPQSLSFHTTQSGERLTIDDVRFYMQHSYFFGGIGFRAWNPPKLRSYDKVTEGCLSFPLTRYLKVNER
ncbi:hypothetical protein AVEN_167650-1 [Araneus ventricosus]|uniref:Uncharacterized protein n=1 Tax=Araneus ventricosus TaxID=182803 RepID=A0A4Y2J5I7_ARAVE|nr:hypothetical protein AVEN_167650-1 [Araneus ventricosus]